jgi:hypothetical protein
MASGVISSVNRVQSTSSVHCDARPRPTRQVLVCASAPAASTAAVAAAVHVDEGGTATPPGSLRLHGEPSMAGSKGI